MPSFSMNLEKKLFGDILHLEWEYATVLNNNEALVLPTEIPLSILNRWRVRKIMQSDIVHGRMVIKQANTWYCVPLSSDTIENTEI